MKRATPILKVLQVLPDLKFVIGGAFRTQSTATNQAENANLDVADDRVRPFEELPEVKGLPLIGPLLDYMPWRGFERAEIVNHWIRRHEQYGDLYKEKIPGRPVTVYCRAPEHTEAMFRYDDRTPHRPILEAFLRLKQAANLPEALLTLNGEEWYKYRKIANSALLVNKMVWKYTNQQREVAGDLVKYIQRNIGEDGEVKDFASVLKKWAFEVSGTFIFSKRLGLLTGSPETEALTLADIFSTQMDFIADSFSGLNMWKYFRTKEVRDVDKATVKMIEIMSAIIARENDSTGDKDTILNRFLDSKQLSEEEKMSMIYDVLGAAAETTTHAAAFMLYALTIKPEVQEKLREEVIELAEDAQSGRAVGNLKYVNAFLKEAFRLFPLAPVFSRSYTKDIVLSGYKIPAGVPVINTSSGTMTRDPKLFPKPGELIPERWMDNKNIINKFSHSGSFGIGSRSCAGRRIAMQEIQLLLIEILKAYRVEYHHKPIVALFKAVSYPSEPPQFKFIPLNS